jgi:hypothetical protein
VVDDAAVDDRTTGIRSANPEADDSAEIAQAKLARAVAVSQQLLDAHTEHPGYRTSAEWLTALARCSQDVNNAASEYLEITSQDMPPHRHVVPVR